MSRILLLIAFWVPVALSGALPGASAEAQTWRTMTSARQIWDSEPLNVDIQYGAGKLEIGSVEAPLMYQMEVRYDEEVFEPVAEYEADERTLHLGVESNERSRRSLDLREGATATIALSRTVPLDLDLEFGAGQAEIELGGMALQRVEISTGASETRVNFGAPNTMVAERVEIEAGAADLEVTGLGNARAERITFQGGVGATVLDFSGEWTSSATASVEIGVGAVTIRLPRDQGIRIDRSSFLTSFTVPGMERQGDSYFSSNWSSAAHQLTIDVSAALGSVEIVWID